MAIHSALSASATLSSTALASEKLCFKLPRSDKRKARLRAEVLKRYVEAVCGSAAGTATQGTAKLQVQECGFEAAASQLNGPPPQQQRQALGGGDKPRRRGGVGGAGAESVAEARAVEWRAARGERMPQGVSCAIEWRETSSLLETETEREAEYERTQQSHGRQQRQRSASKQRREEDVSRRYDSTVHGVMTEMSRQACTEALSHEKNKKDYKRSGKMRIPTHGQPPQPEPILLPRGHTGRDNNDRKKHPRLVGADLYVARLGWSKTGGAASNRLPTVAATPSRDRPRDSDSEGCSLDSSIGSLSMTDSSTSTGSLHDELIDREPSPRRTAIAQETLDARVIRASRPCYRCITHMHTAGIKRVFWTNNAGEWEGGKVRDLVDALDDSMDSVAKGAGGGPTGNGVFVTKHEVLMLRRLMGEGSA
ncbi:hypothetical protein LTR56_015644 [Elasticomyces elasticus]|nr:hypothetical protein LTR56_015644 [Elasticomyces elasticus]